MKMGIIGRVARLITADVHGVLDHLEEPKAILKQAIREMEEEIEQSESRLLALRKQSEKLERAAADAARRMDESTEETRVALGEGDERISRSFCRRMLEAERRLRSLGTQRADLEKQLIEREKALAVQKEKHRQIVEKASLLSDEDSSRMSECGESELYVSERDIDLAILKLKRNASVTA
jgi:phage shock protein A